MRKRVLGHGAGGALIATGLAGLAGESGFDLMGWAAWFGGAVIFHDAVLVPCVLLVGTVTTRLHGSYRRHVQGALMVGGMVTLVALPFVLGQGRRADNPSILPLPYGRNLLIVLATVLVVAACIALWQRPRIHGIRGLRRVRRRCSGDDRGA
ncbi:hypothetical protein [Actinomadura sp. 7K507]|uniref:hypothetical protein n=1 Tax=Actinomadura sp. 7K507 TaxID=2530365 RepID=UPI0010517679|nr:hypothetical protein [Actinomadura sp. 7K507]TDC86020.1 hypothetical protein E1285_24200 [Actinomadura sp. 7K507]